MQAQSKQRETKSQPKPITTNPQIESQVSQWSENVGSDDDDDILKTSSEYSDVSLPKSYSTGIIGYWITILSNTLMSQ